VRWLKEYLNKETQNAQETNALPSVYAARYELPVFTVGDLAFGILICYESNYYYSPRYSAGFQLRRRDA
jgi:hypothetical protein